MDQIPSCLVRRELIPQSLMSPSIIQWNLIFIPPSPSPLIVFPLWDPGRRGVFFVCDPGDEIPCAVATPAPLFNQDFLFNKRPRSGELRTQKLKSHLLRTQSLKLLPLKPGVGQYMAIHAMPTANICPFRSVHLHFFQKLSRGFPVLAG